MEKKEKTKTKQKNSLWCLGLRIKVAYFYDNNQDVKDDINSKGN